MKDLTGRRIGYLTVLGLDKTTEIRPGYKRVFWNVQCICGKVKSVDGNTQTRKKHIQSCGCKTSEIILEKNLEDLSGQKFGRLQVVGHGTRTESGIFRWKCVCDCGKETQVLAQSLKSGRIVSCGCYHSEKSTVDMTGEKCGMLTVLRKSGKTKDGKYHVWECLCDCGRICIVSGVNLRNGGVKSCGCLRSKGERLIQNWLENNKIAYLKEHVFPGCQYLKPLRFDFFIPEHGQCIEFDGIQHFQETGWNHDDLHLRQKRDQIKSKYCQENDIVLQRIKHTDIKHIDQILQEWIITNQK